MQSGVLRLYPPPCREERLEGLYLGHDLRNTGALVFTNFISSLDGRVSEQDRHGRRRVPPAIANTRDWRLYMELLAQGDVVLTSGAHVQAAASHRQELLGFADPYEDLRRWRRERGLSERAVVAAVSRSLDFPVPRGLKENLLVITPMNAPESGVRRLSRAGATVIRSGSGVNLTGREILLPLFERGFRFIYSVGGPRLHHALLNDGQVDRLYLTLAPLALGGEHFDTLTRGPRLQPPTRFNLATLYLDSSAPTGTRQLFASFSQREEGETLINNLTCTKFSY